jgi:D-3-phosphoglycerate dehydrogenase
MARMAGAFRMRVLAYDPHVAAEAVPVGVQRCETLEALLRSSDAVSVHCVLNAQTRHLLGAAQLAQMKPTAFLVNVSRGEIVDEAALLQALRQQRIAGAAFDVYGREPLSHHGHPLSALFAMDNVMLWPHLTFYTQEAMQRLEDDTLARCFEALRGQPVSVASLDPRLRAQTQGVRFVDAKT